MTAQRKSSLERSFDELHEEDQKLTSSIHEYTAKRDRDLAQLHTMKGKATNESIVYSYSGCKHSRTCTTLQGVIFLLRAKCYHRGSFGDRVPCPGFEGTAGN